MYLIIAILFACFFAVFFSLQVGAVADTQNTDTFTAVAGTDDVVMDKRTKNNTALASAVVLSVVVVLGASALSHIHSIKRPTLDEESTV